MSGESDGGGGMDGASENSLGMSERRQGSEVGGQDQNRKPCI